MAERTDDLKSAISVSEMARMLGISRSRFYQLVQEGVFLPPVHDTETRRPFFPPEIQKVNLAIRASNCGANRRPILFYARRSGAPAPRQSRPAKSGSEVRHGEPVDAGLIEDLAALGIEGVTDAQVRSALRSCFPEGTSRVDESQVVRTLYRYLKCQNTADNVGR